MTIAVGPLTRLFSRQMYAFIESRKNWYEPIPINKLLISEFNFWLRNLQKVNGLKIKAFPTTTKIVYSDASNTGYGGYIVERLSNVIARGDFTPSEKQTSSTYRELLAVKLILHSLSDKLRNENVLWFSDNINVSRIIEVGSRRQHLHNLAVNIFDLCVTHNITLQPSWIPREINTSADFLAKIIDSDNWGVDPETFRYIEQCFGKFSIDRFADDLNRKCDRFNTKFICPGSESVNCFTCDWSQDFNWVCPPISMIGDALKHVKLCKAKGVLLVPMWTSSYFWPLLTTNGESFNDFVESFLLLDPYYINYADCKSVFSGFAKFFTIALLINFERF